MSNFNIRCSVNTCKHNDKLNYCTLSSIHVGNNGALAAQKTQTECDSFER